MEPTLQKAQEVPRSELDTAFDVSRSRGWMVVQGMPTTPWGYELHPVRRSWSHINSYGVPVVVGLPEDGERHPRDGAN
jgi:hypothetical protein